MSLAVAVPLGVASAVVYGTSIVVQHRASHHGGDEEDARGLFRLLRDPLWLMAIGGDFIGFLLNIGALSAGPVVVIQPLVVLMLPVALVVSFLMGGPRPGFAEGIGSLAIIAGLAAFLLLIGTPGEGHTPRARYVATAVLIVLGVGVVICLLTVKRGPIVRSVAYGAVAGMYFGTLGVMVDGVSNVVVARGVHGLFTTGRGMVPLVGLLLLGLGGIVLTQVSFQIGKLGATLPANLAADPFTAVLVGAVLLHEHIPLDPVYMCGYLLCVAAVITGAVQLANSKSRTADLG